MVPRSDVPEAGFSSARPGETAPADPPGSPSRQFLPAVPLIPAASRSPLKLHLDRLGATNLITAFDHGFIQVNQTRHVASLIVLADRLIEPWAPRTFDQLAEGDFDLMAGLGVDIVLLGTGRKQHFPHPRLGSRLLERRIGLEVMDTAAACRTYNILTGEGRNVAAALILE